MKTWINIIFILTSFYLIIFFLNDVFVNKSLVYFFIFTIVTYIILIYFSIKSIISKKKIKIPLNIIFVSAIINSLLPIFLYLFSNNIEFYIAHYYICVFLLFISLSLCVYNEFINRMTITNLLIVFAITESFICLLQYFNFINSNSFFKIAGSNLNPNITSMFLVMCLPIFLKNFNQKIKRNKLLNTLFIALILVCIFLLKSRTGYVGVFIIFLIMNVRNYIIFKNRYNLIISIIILTGAFLIVPFLYNFKKNSADGRLFVWKVAIEKVYENPLGYGYGMVQGVYNKAQASKFENEITTENEKNNAEYMRILNNDYLEILLQGGIIGLIVYLSFFVLIFINSFHTTNFFELLGVLSFLVMSCFCFALYSPQVVFVLVIYLSLIKIENKEIKPHKILIYNILSISFIMTFIVIRLIYTQIKIKEISECIKENKISTAKIISNDNFMFASTSEIYNRTIADMYYFEKDFKTASNYYEKAISYAPFPDALSRLAYCKMKLGYYKKAERLLYFSANIQPSSFDPYKNLMVFYSQTGNNKEAKKMAYYILQKKPKRISNKVLKCKQLAITFIKSN